MFKARRRGEPCCLKHPSEIGTAYIYIYIYIYIYKQWAWAPKKKNL